MSDTSTLRYSSDEQSPDRADYSYSYPPEYGFSRADGRAKARPLSRRLPPTPRPRPASVRPLPSIPHYMTCKRCRSCVTTEGSALSPSAVRLLSMLVTARFDRSPQLPPSARPFKGYAGKAALYTQMCVLHTPSPAALVLISLQVQRQGLPTRCTTHGHWRAHHAGGYVPTLQRLPRLVHRSRARRDREVEGRLLLSRTRARRFESADHSLRRVRQLR